MWEGRGGRASQLKQRGHQHPSCTFLLYLGLSRLKGAHPQWWWWWWGDLLYSVCRFQCQSLLDTPSQTPDVSCFTSHLGSSLAQSDQGIKLTIAMY